MPSYSFPYTRHVKQGKSDLISCTAIATMTSQAHRRMVAAPWRRVEPVVSDLPPHNFLQSGFSDAYDASAYCGDYAEGRQIAYATAACYTVTVPGDALSGTVANITSIALAVAGDRWLSGGCIVSAILTTSAAPPSWADVLAATISTPDPVTSADDIDPTWQAPCRKITRSNTGNDSRSTIYLQVAAAAQQYLHIIVRLGDYDSASYLAWVEGGVLIDGGTISVEFDRAVIADPTPAAYAPVRLAVQQTGASMRVVFSSSNYNLTSGYLQLHWGGRMLLSGFVDPTSIRANDANQDLDKHLAPRVTIAGGSSTARAEYVEAYCAEQLVAGYTLWIRAAESPEGAARVRVTVIASDNAPDVTSSAMWDGTAPAVIGTALTFPQAGDWVGIPLTKNATTRKLQIVACVADVPVADAGSAIAVGFPNIGFDLTDMHISQTPALPAAVALPASGIHVMSPKLASGNIFRGINSGLFVSEPLADRGKIGLTSTASASIFGTSYGAWQHLNGSPAAPFSGTYSHLAVWSGEGFFLALDSYTRKWYKAGAMPVALAALTDTTTSAAFDRIVVDGGTVAWVDSSAMQGIKTMGASSAWKTELDTWIDAVLLAKAGNITIAICVDGTSNLKTRAHVYNDTAGVKAVFEAVVDAIDVVIHNSGTSYRVIFRMIDGTVKAWTWNSFSALVEVSLATWTGVSDVGATVGLFWGISGNALLCSGALPSWADDSAIPAMTSRTMLVSGGIRIGIGYG